MRYLVMSIASLAVALVLSAPATVQAAERKSETPNASLALGRGFHGSYGHGSYGHGYGYGYDHRYHRSSWYRWHHGHHGHYYRPYYDRN